MWKLLASGTILTLVLSSLAALRVGPADPGGTQSDGATLDFTSARLYIEYDSNANEAIVSFEAESEGTISGVELRAPSGEAVMALRTRSRIGSGASEFKVQSAKVELEDLLETFPAGLYQLRARTIEGQAQCGDAHLSSVLPSTPEILFPLQGDDGIAVEGLTLQWTDDPSVEGWRIVIEQDEKDGLTAFLPKGVHSFDVPAHILTGNTRSRAEVASIHANGNIVQSEVQFRTE